MLPTCGVLYDTLNDDLTIHTLHIVQKVGTLVASVYPYTMYTNVLQHFTKSFTVVHFPLVDHSVMRKDGGDAKLSYNIHLIHH